MRPQHSKHQGPKLEADFCHLRLVSVGILGAEGATPRDEGQVIHDGIDILKHWELLEAQC